MSILLQVNNLEMSYGPQTILSGASFSVSDKQKIAVVGRNGAGKSTLFRLIVGEEHPTGGEILVHSDTRIGYLTQHSPFLPNETVMDFMMRDSGQESWACAKVAAQFQIKNEHFNLEAASLAGGYQMRVKLSSMLAKEPNLLLLDEPTNYLDLTTLLLLEQFLKKYKGAFLLISHDREFINKTCDQVLEIDQGKTILFPQSLDEYLAYKSEKISSTEKYNKKILQEKERLQVFVDRFRAKASKAAQAKSKMKQIEKLKTIDLQGPTSTSKIRLPQVENKKGTALSVEDLAIGYPEKTVATKINFEISRSERIAIVGDNGQGKTTFLKTIAGELERLSGQFKWGGGIKIGYYAQHTPATMNSQLTVQDFLFSQASQDLSRQEIFEMAGNFLFDQDALKKEISFLSGGEKARLCLAAMLLQKNHVLLLDEPTNHLDFETVEALAIAISESNSTVIFVSHNRTFVETLANGIIEVKNNRAARYHHDYQNYVYHIRKSIEADLSPVQSPQATNTTQPEEQELQRQALKKAKNRINKLESIIEKLTLEKKLLHDWFEANPRDYSEEKGKKMGEIVQQLEQAESEWLEIQSEIESLKQ